MSQTFAHFEITPADWAALRALLDEALALPAAERERWLDALPPSDQRHAVRLRRLLAHANGGADAERLLQTLPKIETGDFATQPPADDAAAPGRTIGPYRLLRPLGEGGMVEVWLAERSDLLQRRQVALKLPRVFLQRSVWSERLAREREILATLEHPNIARLYDAGVAADGQPYLALEFVEGRRIDEHCRERALDVRARLRLVLQVAQAVAHAHAKLVVHRDLKPSNILVTADGQVRLLDFGIAKLLDRGSAEESALTRETGRALTPDYAAPEQIRGEPIGTAADIYSLGVLLYELLAGERPYRLKRGTRAELEESILHAEPLRPSDVAADARLRRELRGDLDTIVLKALKKAPSERYATVEALAADVERYLAGRPVLAHPDGAWYRTRRFVGRHILAVGAAGAVLVAVVAGAGMAAWQAAIARAEQAKAEEVKDFIASILRDADPWTTGVRASTVVDMLRHATQQIDTTFARRPELQVELLDIVGMSLLHRQEYELAETVLAHSAATARLHLQPDHPQAARGRIYMAEMHLERGRFKQARADLESALAALRGRRNADPRDIVTAWWDLSALAIDEGRYDEALAAASRARQHALDRLGERHRLTAGASVNLALAYLYAGKADEALRAAEPAHRLTVDVHAGASTHPQVIEAAEVYGRTLAANGQFVRGAEVLQRAKADAAEAAGASALVVGNLAWKLAALQVEAGETAQALVHGSEALRISSSHHAADTIHHARAQRAYGRALVAARAGAQAEPLLADALRTHAAAMGAKHPDVSAIRVERALSLAYAGRLAEAQRELEAVAPQAGDGAAPLLRARTLYVLGVVKRLARDDEGALRLQQQAQDAAGSGRAGRLAIARAAVEQGLVHVARGRADLASPVLERALAQLQELQPGASPERADAWLGLGRARLQQRKHVEARQWLDQAARFWRELDPQHRWAGEAAYWLAGCDAVLGRHADAHAAYARAADTLQRSPIPADADLAKLARGALSTSAGSGPARATGAADAATRARAS
ncbi:serine/threonine protein kinase [Aquincola sp. S2]|uniref:Serine/threonine protein kinase n=1 Tax=Pseudaquabacterium terrae TaxID=2732868 RepID=A0ABX2EN07_9BURK|nr:serine/threonine-protein kinase [Aquabacterium terrae]NRF70052.1 serine/threonine protein kinase [Aquabacterium terrae]